MPHQANAYIFPSKSKEKWDDKRDNAGLETSSAHEKTEESRVQHHPLDLNYPEKDHLYNLIDVPDRDRPVPLFGQAKPFPQVTRAGYRGYIDSLLHHHPHHNKHDEDTESTDTDDHHASIEHEHEMQQQQQHAHHHHHHIFSKKDFGFLYRIKTYYHAELAEFLGVFVFLCFGFASTCQHALSSAKSNYTVVLFAWGVGQMCGIYIAGGYSGAHLNPVLTLNLWFFRGFPMQRVFTFWIAQFAGAFVATATIFILYYPALKKLDPDGWSLSTGSLFFTLPAEGIPTATAWFNEVLSTGLIHVVIFAVGDSHNINPARGTNALVLGFTVIAIGSTFGYLSPFGMNPARDFGPRIFLSMVGFPKQLWTTRKWWWVTGEFTGPLLGGYLGSLAYDMFIFDGPESPVNFPRSVKMRVVMHWLNKIRHPFGGAKLSDLKLPNKRHRTQDPERGTVRVQGQPAQ